MGKKIALLLLSLSFLSLPAAAAPDSTPAGGDSADAVPRQTIQAGGSGLPIPRFASLGSDKVFVRTGPALRYPIKWVYQRGRLPVEIIQEFDTWRKIRDIDGDDGWIHQSLLSGSRSVIIKGEQSVMVRKDPEVSGKPLAMLEPNVVARLETCDGDWCRIEAQGYKGWTERKFLWGIYDAEEFD